MLKEVPAKHYSNASQLHPENKRRRNGKQQDGVVQGDGREVLQIVCSPAFPLISHAIDNAGSNFPRQ